MSTGTWKDSTKIRFLFYNKKNVKKYTINNVSNKQTNDVDSAYFQFVLCIENHKSTPLMGIPVWWNLKTGAVIRREYAIAQINSFKDYKGFCITTSSIKKPFDLRYKVNSLFEKNAIISF